MTENMLDFGVESDDHHKTTLTTVLPAVFLPPVSWYAKAWALRHTVELMPPDGHYVKQTLWNRVYIRGANRVETWVVPIEKCGKREAPRICYRQPWPQLFIRALQTGYGKTAFFEFYAPSLFELLLARPPHLSELNLSLIDVVNRFLQLPAWDRADKNLPFDTKILHHRAGRVDDPAWRFIPYFQPFGGFEMNLSVLDLLFNCGPEAGEILKAGYIPQSLHADPEE